MAKDINTVKDNLNRLKDKLLDLGKRNQMLYLKTKAKTLIQINHPDSDTIYHRILDGKNLRLVRKIDLLDKKQMANLVREIEQNNKSESKEENIYTNEDINLTKHHIPFSLIQDKIKEDYVISSLNDFELMARASRTKSRAKTLNEDSGVDALFLVLKVVIWKDTPTSDEWYKAPLLMVPTSLVKDTNNSYVFNPSEDEIIVNQALKIHFQKQFNINIPELIETDDGFEIDDFLHHTQELLSKVGFEIVDEVYIGIFAFSKIAMYRDLTDNFEYLLENNFVKAMTGGEAEFPNLDSTLDKIDKKIDQITTSEDSLIVVPADGSQLRAIEMAKAGLSFVIQGPPGTGKSQTITNLIAELISIGKKILFVSEKQAALNVVYKNLAKVNLGEFCLILHSTKTKKDVVIDELYSAFKSNRIQALDRQQEYSKRDQLRIELADYVEVIHTKNSKLGLSIYSSLSRFFGYPESLPYNYFPEMIRFSSSEAEQQVDGLKQIVSFYGLFKPQIELNPLYGIKGEIPYDNPYLQISYWDSTLLNIEDLNKQFNSLNLSSDSFNNLTLGNNKRIESLIGDLVKKNEFDFEDVNSAWFNFKDVELVYESLELIKGAFVFLIDFEQKLKHYKGDPYEIPTSLLSDLQNQRAKWYWPINIKYYQSINKLNKFHSEEPINLNKKTEIELLIKYRKQREIYNRFAIILTNLFNIRWDGIHSDIAIIESQISDFYNLHKTYDQLSTWFEKTAESKLMQLDLGNFRRVSSSLLKIKDLIKSFTLSTKNLMSLFTIKPIDDNSPNVLKMKEYIYNGSQSINDYQKWNEFVELNEKIKENQLSPFVEFYIKSTSFQSNISDIFRKSFYHSWVKHLIDKNKITSGFFKDIHEQKIEDFVQIDNFLLEFNRSRVREKVFGYKPVSDNDFVSPQSEEHVLAREYNKKRNKLSVRRLFQQIPNLIREVKPIVMMSPITVSNYLNFQNFKFDVLIFDEASQIFPYDAIGCLARANQVIIAGDENQLPPTNFFLTNDDMEQENDEDEGPESTNSTEFDSILNLASSRLRSVGLKWHYRSRNEELISFSNKEIYKNSLITFPSINDDVSDDGVEFVYVKDGVYDRGNSTTNRIEAEKIIELVFNHIEAFENRSLGVVTVNSKQQELIENLLSKLAQGNAKIESFINGTTNHAEPFFVKNIESVQGDERDTIILGIGYGKDLEGHFTMNFGPINKQGGEKRLNVAITRAKHNLKVVSSVKGDEFKITEKTPRGVKLLSNYLLFAEKGSSILTTLSTNNLADSESGFENDVADFLTKHGFIVEKKVGVSAFKIDLAIRDPKKPKLFSLGIECDGDTYKMTKTVRDRDSLRHQVLERLGWNIYRVWSADWFSNNTRAKANLLEAANAALNKLSIINNTSNSSIEKSTFNISKDFDNTNDTVKHETAIDNNKITFDRYIEIDNEVEELVSLNDFQSDEPNYRGFIKIFNVILENESPIHISRLLYLLRGYYGREKVTVQVQRWFDYQIELLKSSGKIKYLKKDDFFINPKQKEFRFRKMDSKIRNIENIYFEELLDLVKRIIEHKRMIHRESLIIQVGKHCNYTTISKILKEQIGDQIQKMINLDLINVDYNTFKP